MASATEVKTYLAQWFQLGKKLVWSNGEAEPTPQKILMGEHFSTEFETCWQKIINSEGKDCYLEGSVTTIAKLLSSEWIIEPCSRCQMPVPIFTLGIQALDCTCSDLDNWPNSELPAPHLPKSSRIQLEKISERLKRT